MEAEYGSSPVRDAGEEVTSYGAEGAEFLADHLSRSQDEMKSNSFCLYSINFEKARFLIPSA